MPLDISRIQALIFDVDGTLSDTDDRMAAKVARLAQPFRWALPSRDPQRFARWFVMTLETPGNFIFGLPDRLNIDNSLSRLSNSLARLGWGYRSPDFWIIPQVRPALDRLYTRYPLAIASARDERGTHDFLEQYQLKSYFKAVATALTCEHTKPYPHPIQWAAERIGVPPTAPVAPLAPRPWECCAALGKRASYAGPGRT
jgi:phosphoglycolate phosphatase-like HAD superfamily hydrolase